MEDDLEHSVKALEELSMLSDHLLFMLGRLSIQKHQEIILCM